MFRVALAFSAIRAVDPLRLRVRPRFLTLLLPVLICSAPLPAAAAPAVKAEVAASTDDGYARIVFRFNEEVEADVRLANGIVVMNFKTAIDVPIDRLGAMAIGYVSAARRDPDGKGLRIALARKVTINSMMAGDRLFVDLLPDTWKGPPPALPREVVEELARRAREAEKKVRKQLQVVKQRQMPMTRIRVAHQPTFSRYIFELAELIPVAVAREKDALTLVFDAPLKFDLADAKASPPPTIEAIDAESRDQSTAVRFFFIGHVDVRSFREDNSYVVDIGAIENGKARRSDAPPAEPDRVTGLEAPPEIAKPAVTAPPARVAAPAPPAPPPPAPAAAPAAVPAAAGPAPASIPAADPAPARVEKKPEIVAKPRDPNGPVSVELQREADGLRIVFPFASATPAAVFQRADTLWAVFDTGAKIDVAALAGDAARAIRSASLSPSRNGQVVRIKLARPRLATLSAEEAVWAITLGDAVLEPTRPLLVSRNMTGAARLSASIAFDDPRTVHRLTDPEIGDTLLVVTALGPARGFLKSQDFVEFRALASTHGVAIQPLADDLNAELSADKIVLSRPNGLVLSPGEQSGRRVGGFRPAVFDPNLWGFDRQAEFEPRRTSLVNAAADARETKRTPARLELARFYLARDMYAEAKGVLDVALGDEPSTDDASGLVMRAVANVLLGRPEDALKDLANPIVGNQHEAQLWRALAHARHGDWAEAHENFRNVEAAIATLPIELQRLALKEALRASIEVRDYAAAANELNGFDTLGVGKDLEGALAVLTGRLAEGLGRSGDALGAYRTAAGSPARPAAAQGRLRETVLRYQLGDLKRSDVIADLEELTMLWRGDETEIESLQVLARLYTEDSRYRDAFHVMRVALTAHPNSDMTRRIQEEAAATFDSLFLAGRGDGMSAIDALGLFYDFRELTPIGRRGDEMIRRLADRLVSVDLLDQATELLQHQVDHRLQGAARAQVATRLAVIYLMARKPDRALTILRGTHTGNLATELRSQRLLIESRALSDLGRPDLAIEVIANISGPEALRLRSDIYWAAKRWREAAEHLELLHGERWRDWQPLTDPERGDILRAAIGYALGEDPLGLQRFREKYAPKMANGPDRRAFEIATAPLAANAAEFRDVARVIAAANTLESFLRDMRARYPETGAFTSVPSPARQSAAPDRMPTAALTEPTPRNAVR